MDLLGTFVQFALQHPVIVVTTGVSLWIIAMRATLS